MTVYGLLGRSIGYSFSPKYFKLKFEKENIQNSEYRLFPLSSIDKFPELLRSNPSIAGLNVTIPYKTSVIRFMDEISDEVRAIGAINCISVHKNRCVGYNTDAMAFKETMHAFQGKITTALILGSGGASKAVAYALSQLKINFDVVSRNPDEMQLSYNEIDLTEYDLIVNSTPLGMSPYENEIPEIDLDAVKSKHMIYDLNYNPSPTKLMKLAAERGATVKDGLEMLEKQAELSWKIWNKH